MSAARYRAAERVVEALGGGNSGLRAFGWGFLWVLASVLLGRACLRLETYQTAIQDCGPGRAPMLDPAGNRWLCVELEAVRR